MQFSVALILGLFTSAGALSTALNPEAESALAELDKLAEGSSRETVQRKIEESDRKIEELKAMIARQTVQLENLNARVTVPRSELKVKATETKTESSVAAASEKKAEEEVASVASTSEAESAPSSPSLLDNAMGLVSSMFKPKEDKEQLSEQAEEEVHDVLDGLDVKIAAPQVEKMVSELRQYYDTAYDSALEKVKEQESANTQEASEKAEATRASAELDVENQLKKAASKAKWRRNNDKGFLEIDFDWGPVSDNMKLGVVIDEAFSLNHTHLLLVQHIVDHGLLKYFNDAHPERAVKVGDYISQVNEVRGQGTADRMLEKMKSGEKLKIKFTDHDMAVDKTGHFLMTPHTAFEGRPGLEVADGLVHLKAKGSEEAQVGHFEVQDAAIQSPLKIAAALEDADAKVESEIAKRKEETARAEKSEAEAAKEGELRKEAEARAEKELSARKEADLRAKAAEEEEERLLNELKNTDSARYQAYLEQKRKEAIKNGGSWRVE